MVEYIKGGDFMHRAAGLLLGVASLPSPYGIGDFGPNAYEFIDLLHNHHISIWQVLPTNPLGYGHSPYQPYSSKAGEPLLISLDSLYHEGLISKPIAPSPLPKTIDYEAVARFKEPYFKEAYRHLKVDVELQKQFQRFIYKHPWVKDYGLFMAFKQKNNQRCWVDWETDDKNYPHHPKAQLIIDHWETINYTMFLQFLFFKQWQQLKAYGHKKGIAFIGDIPFYLGLDSVDVWTHQDQFQLDEQGHQTVVAGVPPDYFSPTGQRWGNPIYHWEIMKKDHYAFWLDRLAFSQSCFDYVRIDHFRAFDTYWQIPSSCPTAVDGQWCLGPSHDFFDTVYDKYPNMQLIAEDLGDLRDEVHALRNDYKLPGMQVIQFHLHPNEPFYLHPRTVLYTGTHDNETLYGWYLNLPYQEKLQFFNLLRDALSPGLTFNQRMMTFCLASNADTVIFPVQDVLELGNEARINTPGTLGNHNWVYRLDNLSSLEAPLTFLAPYIIQYKRNTKG